MEFVFRNVLNKNMLLFIHIFWYSFDLPICTLSQRDSHFSTVLFLINWQFLFVLETVIYTCSTFLSAIIIVVKKTLFNNILAFFSLCSSNKIFHYPVLIKCCICRRYMLLHQYFSWLFETFTRYLEEFRNNVYIILYMKKDFVHARDKAP
jgi:hypothetical protein